MTFDTYTFIKDYIYSLLGIEEDFKNEYYDFIEIEKEIENEKEKND